MLMGAPQAHKVLPRKSRVIARERRDRCNLTALTKDAAKVWSLPRKVGF